ncbi:MAG: RNA 2',3'-cyclic phosphodiesterase [Spirochaetota bacterium]
MTRLFFALAIPVHIRREVFHMVRPILPEPFFRVVSAENLHITMAFLGEVHGDERRRAIEIARSFDPKHAPGTEEARITITGAGAFPRIAKPRVVWLGIRDAAGALHDIHAGLIQELDAAGLPYDPKPLRPHLTVAYLRKPRSRAGTEDAHSIQNALVSLRQHAASREWSFPLPAVRLYESRLLSTGAVYQEL